MRERKRVCVREKRLIGRTCEKEMEECECVGYIQGKKRVRKRENEKKT